MNKIENKVYNPKELYEIIKHASCKDIACHECPFYTSTEYAIMCQYLNPSKYTEVITYE